MVAGNDVEEVGKVANVAQTGAVDPDLQEHVLHNFFSDGLMPGNLQGKSKDRIAIMIENDAKSTFIPLRHPFQERIFIM